MVVLRCYAKSVMPPSPYRAPDSLARQIAAEATLAGAGRIAFQRSGEFFFVAPESGAIGQLLADESPRKYKFQVRSDGRWVDASKYVSVASVHHVVPALRLGKLDRLMDDAPDVIARAAASDPEAFSVALRSLHRHLFDALNRDPRTDSVAQAHQFLSRQTPLHGDQQVDFLRSTVALYAVMVDHDLRHVLAGHGAADLVEVVQARVADHAEDFSSTGSQIAVANVLGKLCSLEDRTAAARHFERVRALDHEGVIEHFYLETGSKTYFSSEEVEGIASGDARDIRGTIEPLDASGPGNSLAIAIAMDVGFYRTYAPMLRFFAQQMPDVDYNFLICGSRDEALEAVADAGVYARSLATLNRSGNPRNVHHFWMPVPVFVADPVTFYACARFFAVQMLLDRYVNVYLMDADLATGVDPRPYLRRVAKLPFALPSMSGFTALHPWRRYMAGNVALNRGVLETPVLTDLQDYVALGLRQPHSWTLDQNALAYTIERNRSTFADLNGYDRPYSQPKFRLAWERRHRESAGTI